MTTIKSVLYAEDDENDAFLMERSFQKLKVAHPLRIVPDGKMAIAYLSGSAPFANRAENPVPGLMFLDLSMPGKTGLEVLQWIVNQPALAELPVIVLTSSNQSTDIQRAKSFGAKGYFVKPGDPDVLISIVKATVDYWLSENRPAIDPPGAFRNVAL